MDRGALKWLTKTARQNLWRVQSWCDLDDLIQDGHLCWHRIITRYPDAVEPAHRMRLFQTTYLRYLHTLSRRTVRHPLIESEQAEICPDAETAKIIVELPLTVRQVLAALEANSGVFSRPYRCRLDGTRETLYERLARAMRVDDDRKQIHMSIRELIA